MSWYEEPEWNEAPEWTEADISAYEVWLEGHPEMIRMLDALYAEKLQPWEREAA